MIGYDVSRYQTPGTTPLGDFVIVQAGRGRDPAPGNPVTGGLIDKRCADHVRYYRAHGVRISLYWRFFPETDAMWQAEMLVALARQHGIEAPTLWLDIENPSSGEAWPGDARAYEQWVRGRVNALGFEGGTYANESFWTNRGIGGEQGRWVANFSRAPFILWHIHQRTSNPLDTNEAHESNVARFFDRPAPPPSARYYSEDLLLLH